MNLVQMGAIAAVVCILVYRVVPWSSLKWPKKKARGAGGLQVTLHELCELLQTDEDWQAWMRMKELSDES